MADFRAHVLHDQSFVLVDGPVLFVTILAIIAITVACFFLNAVFAFAITQPGDPKIRPAIAEARRHRKPIALSGGVVGLGLAIAVTIAPRWGSPWFALSLGIVCGVMMVAYVAVPSRLIGTKTVQTRRDKLVTSAVAGALGFTVSVPPYVLARAGLLLIGSDHLLILGIILLALGATLQAGATGAVRAIKMSASLAGGDQTAGKGS